MGSWIESDQDTVWGRFTLTFSVTASTEAEAMHGGRRERVVLALLEARRMVDGAEIRTGQYARPEESALEPPGPVFASCNS